MTMARKKQSERSGWSHLAVLCAYAVLTGLMTWPLARHLADAIPGDGFDGWQNYWNLWWVKVALVEHVQTPFVTDLLYHPTGVRLYFHTLNPFNGLVTLPIQLSAGLLPAYNAAVFVSWVLAGYGMFLLASWLLRGQRQPAGRLGCVRGALPPFLAGAIYTFAPFHMAHLLGHMQVMSLQWIPFYALYLLRALDRGQTALPWRRDALWAGFYLALAGLCDWYFVLYLFFFTALAVIWAALAGWRSRRRLNGAAGSRGVMGLLGQVRGPPLLAAGFFFILLSPLLIPMLREALQFSFMVRPTTDLYILSASLADFLVPNRLHSLWRPASFAWIGNQVAPVSERTIGIGYLALGLAAYAVWVDRRRATFWWICALFFMFMAMGPVLHLGNITWDDIPAAGETPPAGWTPYALLNRLIPFMRISRSVSRFALMVQFSAAILAAFGLAALLVARRRAAGVLAVGACALAVVLAEYWTVPYPLSPPDTPAFYHELAATPGAGAVLNLPMNYDRPGYLLYQTVHGRPLTVAYISRDDPRTLTERAPVLQHFRHLGPDIVDVDPAAVGETVLADLGVETVVLDRYKMPGGLEREYTESLAQAIFAGQAPIFEDERITVHAVQPPEAPAAYALLGEANWGPLQETATGTRGRFIGPGPAELHLRHAPADAWLRVRYRTVGDQSLTIGASGVDPPLAVLPPAPDGAAALLDLPAWRAESGVGDTLVLLAKAADAAMIEGIGFAPPP